MIPVALTYASPSALQSTRDRADVALSASQQRPVRFLGRVLDPLTFRLCMQTLGQVIWSDEAWLSEDEYRYFVLDPVVTVHPDRLMFEALSQDGGVYAALLVERDEFETDGTVTCGTTNIDFTAWLHGALGELRSSRKTTLRVESQGVEVQTEGAGGRYEHKVDLPESWLRGFLEMSAAAAFPGTKLSAAPVDVLAIIRLLKQNKAKVSPRALRYEMVPGHDATAILEPWEHEIPLVGASHGYQVTRSVRTWGRRRLRLLEPLLPYADSVEIYLKGRAMPTFYAVNFGGYTFVLGLSGWNNRSLSSSEGMSRETHVDQRVVDEVLSELVVATTLDVDDAASRCSVESSVARKALDSLVRRGRAVFDVRTRNYRHRELFDTPLDVSQISSPDPRDDRARRWVQQGRVRGLIAQERQTEKTRTFRIDSGKRQTKTIYRDTVLRGQVADQAQVQVVLSQDGEVIFGKCGCAFFRENILAQGPCAHMRALVSSHEAHQQQVGSDVTGREEEQLDT